MYSNSRSLQLAKLLFILLSAALVLSAIVLFSNQAKAENCPEIPSVSWWNDTTPEMLTANVDRKHDGDWDPYIKKWESYEEQMRDILFRGKAAVIKSSGQILKGEDLAGFIKLIGQRVEATRCIADEVIDARLIEELSNMETAAGGNPELEIRLVE
jgi:hypothetical protein